jgi:hypothetical protein
MGLVKEHQRKLTKVFAHLVEGLVGDYGNAAVAREVLFYFSWMSLALTRDFPVPTKEQTTPLSLARIASSMAS